MDFEVLNNRHVMRILLVKDDKKLTGLIFNADGYFDKSWSHRDLLDKIKSSVGAQNFEPLQDLYFFFLPPPIPVERAVLDRLRQMMRLNCVDFLQVRDRARDFEQLVVRPGGEAEFLDGLP